MGMSGQITFLSSRFYLGQKVKHKRIAQDLYIVELGDIIKLEDESGTKYTAKQEDLEAVDEQQKSWNNV